MPATSANQGRSRYAPPISCSFRGILTVSLCRAERPTCQNCIKSNCIYSGYQRSSAFILSNNMVRLGSEPSKSTGVLDQEANSGSVLISRWRKHQAKTVPLNQKSSISTPPILPIGQVIPRPAYRAQLVHFFLYHRVPTELLGPLRASEWGYTSFYHFRTSVPCSKILSLSSHRSLRTSKRPCGSFTRERDVVYHEHGGGLQKHPQWNPLLSLVRRS